MLNTNTTSSIFLNPALDLYLFITKVSKLFKDACSCNTLFKTFKNIITTSALLLISTFYKLVTINFNNTFNSITFLFKVPVLALEAANPKAILTAFLIS